MNVSEHNPLDQINVHLPSLRTCTPKLSQYIQKLHLLALILGVHFNGFNSI